VCSSDLVVVVNSYYRRFPNMRVAARVLNLDMAEKFSREAAVDIAEDSSVRVFALPDIDGLSGTYFVSLELRDASGAAVSRNFYWLSTTPETLDWDKSNWYYTPTRTFADFTALNGLPRVDLQVTAQNAAQGSVRTTTVTVTNPGKTLAFAVHLKVTQGSGGAEVLPVLWEDNYFPLLPGETRRITATYRAQDLGPATPAVAVDGWNVKSR
jgi:exo-1,4-beta-D-glucosaminidase